jgi:hypothetical protein
MVLLSLALGMFISYFFVFVNALFISEIGTSQLPLAYVFSGLGGTLITWLFNISEKKWGFAKSSTLFCLFFALVMYILWYFYVQGLHLYILIFFSYAWFWVSINFTTLIFWKLPSYIFDLRENKKYNGIMSTGEVVSAIVAYLSVPALLNLDFFTRDKLLLVSFTGIAIFTLITFYLGKNIKVTSEKVVKSETQTSNLTQKNIVREPYFQLIFLSIFLAVIIQLLIDFSLMEVSAQQMSDPKELAKYFAFLFGGMRVLELILKSFVSKYLVREYGVFISLSTLIFALAFIAIVGISSLFFGYFGLILIVASLSKVFERSMYRSIYAPTINVLYQAYPSTKRALTQNYADGFGKTIGQLMAAIILFIIATINTFETRVFVLLLSILLILSIWFLVSKKLIFHYKIELLNILNSLGNNTQSTSIKSNEKEIKNSVTDIKSSQIEYLSIKEQFESIKILFDLESQEESLNDTILLNSSFHNSQNTSDKEFIEILTKSISTIKGYDKNDLSHLLNYINSLENKTKKESKLLQLLNLYIQISLFKKSTDFNFYNSNKKLRTFDFFSSALIQNLTEGPIRNLSNQDYYHLLEERIHKYTYLLACYRDFGKSNSLLSQMILSEARATKYDILYALNFNHDPQILNQIILMLNQGEKSQELIALELLELVLEEQEKKWLLPIFREENQENILTKLEAEFPQVLLGKEKRLISILGNNQQDIPSIIKSEALRELIKLFPDPKYHQLASAIAKKSKAPIRRIGNEIEQTKSNYLEQGIPNQQKFIANLSGEQISETYQATEINTSLQYFHWIKDPNSQDSQEHLLNSLYKILYQSVFPMEKMNVNLQE